MQSRTWCWSGAHTETRVACEGGCSPVPPPPPPPHTLQHPLGDRPLPGAPRQARRALLHRCGVRAWGCVHSPAEGGWGGCVECSLRWAAASQPCSAPSGVTRCAPAVAAAGNELYELWEGLKPGSPEYVALKVRASLVWLRWLHITVFFFLRSVWHTCHHCHPRGLPPLLLMI